MPRSHQAKCSCFFLLCWISVSVAAPRAESKPASYGYRVIHIYPHDPKAFTQGLIYRDGYLYESTGWNGQSSLRRVDLQTGAVLQRYDLPVQYFGEGLTNWKNTLIQLTWKAHTGFVYDRRTFHLLRTFHYEVEGWGLTEDGAHIILSDGSATLRFLDPQTFQVVKSVVVTDGGIEVHDLNELEYIRGHIYANIWETNLIAVISPKDGHLLAWIDLSGLRPASTLSNSNAVLNGIAFDALHHRLFVTGKLWPKLFQIELVRKIAPGQKPVNKWLSGGPALRQKTLKHTWALGPEGSSLRHAASHAGAKMLLCRFRDSPLIGNAQPLMPSLTECFEFALLALTSIFFLVDPFAVIPLFLAVTSEASVAERRHMARRSALTCAIVLCAFALAGSLIFKLFGITLPAFKIAGGIILLQIGIDMLQAKPSGQRTTPEETKEGAAKEDASIIPLGMPMLAGPGAISTVMVLVGESHTMWRRAVVYAAILITSFGAYLVLAGASRVRCYMGETGIRILTRLMGLLLVALAVQFVANGLIDFGLLKPPVTH